MVSVILSKTHFPEQKSIFFWKNTSDLLAERRKIVPEEDKNMFDQSVDEKKEEKRKKYMPEAGIEPGTFRSTVRCLTHYTTSNVTCVSNVIDTPRKHL